MAQIMKGPSDARLVRETPGFRDLDLAVLEALLAKATMRTIEAGSKLFDTGQTFLDEVYIVRRGQVELRRADGRVEVATPGYLVGLSSYLGDSPYASSAVATEPTIGDITPPPRAVLLGTTGPSRSSDAQMA